jgi:hypothetical protein
MNMRPLKMASLCLAALPLLAGCGSSGGIQDSIKGHWVSTTCEVRPGASNSKLYIKRDYTIRDTTWTGALTFYTDETCATSSVVAIADGPYSVGGAAKVSGAYEAAFVLETMTLTTKDPGTNYYLNTAPANTCGTKVWQVNVAQDITRTKGCGLLGVDLVNCGTEYEIIKLQNNQLLFGARPADGSGPCTPDKRTSTDSYQGPLEKVN